MKGIIKTIYGLLTIFIISIILAVFAYTMNSKNKQNIIDLDIVPERPFDIVKSIPVEKPKHLIMPKHMQYKPIEIHEVNSNVITVHAKGTYTCTSELAAPFIILIDEGERVYFCMGYDSKLVAKLLKPEYADEYTVEIYAPKGSFPIEHTNNIIEYSDFTIDEKYMNSGLKDVLNLPKNNLEFIEVEKVFKKLLVLIKKKDMEAIKAMMTDMPGYEEYKMDEKAIKEFNAQTFELYAVELGVSSNTLLAAEKVGLPFVWAHLIQELSVKTEKCKIKCIKKAMHKGSEHYIVIAEFIDSDVNGGQFRFWFRYVDGKLMMDNFD